MSLYTQSETISWVFPLHGQDLPNLNRGKYERNGPWPEKIRENFTPGVRENLITALKMDSNLSKKKPYKLI